MNYEIPIKAVLKPYFMLSKVVMSAQHLVFRSSTTSTCFQTCSLLSRVQWASKGSALSDGCSQSYSDGKKKNKTIDLYRDYWREKL